MINVEKLIEQLEAWNEQHLSVVCGNGHFACDYLCENEDCIVVRPPPPSPRSRPKMRSCGPSWSR